MAYLVTGGAGFIGSHLVEALLAAGERVICLDNFDDFYDPAVKRANLARAAPNPRFRLVVGDLRQAGTLEEIFRGERIKKVIHLAARAGVRPSIQEPHLYGEVNVCGTINLLEACRKYGRPQVIFASSSSVYGNNPKLPSAEGDPADDPVSPYAATKRAGELICRTYHHLYGMDIACLRYFTVYGPRQRPEMAIHRFTRSIAEGRRITLFGNGNSRRDYTFIDDAIAGTLGALRRRHGCEAYNIGESQTISLAQLVQMIEERVGRKALVEHLPPQPGDVEQTCADLRKSAERLGYRPRVDIREGLDRFIRWYLAEGRRE